MQTLINLFTNQLQDAYSAETQILEALPRMAEAASSQELKAGFEQHKNETRRQIERLKEVARLVSCGLGEQTCEAMAGLLEEGEEMIDMDADPHVRDAGLIAAAQKVEHYEIALYGCLCTWAEELDLADVKHILGQTLEEEKHSDARLTELADHHLNAQARR